MDSKYHRIQLGMTVAEAETILGPPTIRLLTPIELDQELPLPVNVLPLEIDPVPAISPHNHAKHYWHLNQNWIFLGTVDGKIVWRCWLREMSDQEAMLREWLRWVRGLLPAKDSSRADEKEIQARLLIAWNLF
jgi:hypothetical protein